jgi:hypothetical protein
MQCMQRMHAQVYRSMQTHAKQMPTQKDLSIVCMRHEHASPQHARMVPSRPLSLAQFTLPASLAGAIILTLPVDCAIAIGCKRSHFWDDVARPVCGSALNHSDTCQRKRASVNAKATAGSKYPVPSPTPTLGHRRGDCGGGQFQTCSRGLGRHRTLCRSASLGKADTDVCMCAQLCDCVSACWYGVERCVHVCVCACAHAEMLDPAALHTTA